ncbi:MAG: 7TM diverse intracellular signaling domain-containing protein, partial [Saprospiraceae bacterium]
MHLEAGSAYWVRFPLRNDSHIACRRFLRLSASDFLETRLYLLPTGNGADTDGSLPPPVPDQGRQVSVFPLDFGPGEEKTVLLYLDRRYLPISTKITLYTDIGLLAREQRASFGGGVYSGAALLYLLIALFLLALFRNRESAYYLLYTFGSASYIFYSRFIPLKEWLHAGSVGCLFDSLSFISVACSVLGQLGLFALIFSLSRWKQLNGLANGLKVICALLIITLLFWPFLVAIDSRLYLWVVCILAGCSLSIVLFMVVGGPLLFWRRRRPEEAIFLLGFAPFVLVVVVIWFMEGGWLTRSATFYDNAPGLITFYESLVLGVLLIYQEIRERIRLRLALDNERLELVQDLHSGLLPELDTLAEINQREVRPDLPAVAHRIDELGNELSEDLRALMWTLTRTDGGTLDELVARLRQKVHSRFAGSGTVCRFVTEPQILPEDLPVSFTVSYHLFH